jgi:O-antigen/teichoic acid export membrane protein
MPLRSLPPGSPPAPTEFWSDAGRHAPLIARNVAVEYVAIAVNIILGVVMLPFNVHHLGQAAYGLWVLVTSLTTYFSMLDLGYGSAQVKFAAQYRAQRDAQALNQIASTLFFLFLGFAVIAYAAAVVIALNLEHFFRLTPDQVATGQKVLLIVSVNVALGLPFSVFGGIVNGFQRYYLNNTISITTSLLTTAANIAVLMMGYGIVPLVACTTAIRVLSLFAYRRSAYVAFPLLSIRWANVRRTRLHEVTAFSVFLLAIDIAGKINYSADTMVIGAMLGTAAIAVWSVAARLIDVTRMLTTVFSRLLFPTVVDSSTRNRLDRLRVLLVEGTRVSLAAAVPMAAVSAILADQLVQAWVGPRFADSVTIIWILAVVVTVRVGTTTATMLLRGCGLHRLVAWNSIGLALANLGLSVVFAKLFGLPGVALGTLLPLTAISLFVYVPAACRRAELPLPTFLRTAVWPTLWPMVPVGLALVSLRGAAGAHLTSLGVTAVAAGLAYALLFVGLALGRDARDWYIAKLRSIWHPRSVDAGVAT